VDNAVEKGLKQLQQTLSHRTAVDLVKKASKTRITSLFISLNDIPRADYKLMRASGECGTPPGERRAALWTMSTDR
jgi:hypothetical protein